MASLPDSAPHLIAAAAAAGDDVMSGLALAAEYGAQLPQPGSGVTDVRWALLALAAAEDLTCARILEAHSDALAILHESGGPAEPGTWGVFAAEAPDARLDASADGRLSGKKAWCSLAGVLDHALVTARVGDARQLFAVDLRHPSVRVDPVDRWVARGLANVTSTCVHFDATPARPVGDPGWYLRRPGFAWGGLGVAACWFGGVLGLQQQLVEASAGRDGELTALHLGTVDALVHSARTALRVAADAVDAGRAGGTDGATLALRTRATVAEVAERVIRQVGHALGPAPLAFDERHARRVADLELYVRQHHAERDLAALGAAGAEAPLAAIVREGL